MVVYVQTGPRHRANKWPGSVLLIKRSVFAEHDKGGIPSATGPIAQRLELPAHNRMVLGSNPSGPTGGSMYVLEDRVCLVCGEDYMPDKPWSKFCSRTCADIGRRAQLRPTTKELIEAAKTTTKVALASKYGVSETAVRKWLRAV